MELNIATWYEVVSPIEPRVLGIAEDQWSLKFNDEEVAVRAAIRISASVPAHTRHPWYHNVIEVWVHAYDATMMAAFQGGHDVTLAYSLINQNLDVEDIDYEVMEAQEDQNEKYKVDLAMLQWHRGFEDSGASNEQKSMARHLHLRQWDHIEARHRARVAHQVPVGAKTTFPFTKETELLPGFRFVLDGPREVITEGLGVGNIKAMAGALLKIPLDATTVAHCQVQPSTSPAWVDVVALATYMQQQWEDLNERERREAWQGNLAPILLSFVEWGEGTIITSALGEA